MHLPASASAPPKLCTGCDESGASLEGADFSAAIYIGANFEGADLRRASFRGAKLVGANFNKADLRDAVLDASDCVGCNFSGAQLDGASFTGATIVAANFAGFSSALDDAGLRELLARCVACSFQRAALANRNLSNLVLYAVDFSGADLRGTDFGSSVLCWYDGKGAQRAATCDKFANARTDGANFTGVVICDEPAERQHCAAVPASQFLTPARSKP